MKHAVKLDMVHKTDEKSSPWKTWVLPFVIGGGMGLGSLLGVTAFSDALPEEGPAGDLAGAAGALIVGLCLLAGFSLALLAVWGGKVMRRRPVRNISTGLLFSILGGGVIGALGAFGGGMPTTVSWCLLIVLPILLAWPWRS